MNTINSYVNQYMILKDMKKKNRITYDMYKSEKLKNLHFITNTIYEHYKKNLFLYYNYNIFRKKFINIFIKFMNNNNSKDTSNKNTLINFFKENKLYFFAIHYYIFPKFTYDSKDDIINNRKYLIENIDFLTDKFKINLNKNLDLGLGITYPLSYQNMNNVHIFTEYCKLFRNLFPELNYKSSHIENIRNKKLINNSKIKIAFFSEYLISNHSVTRDRAGIIKNLSRDIFDIYLISFKNNISKSNLVKDLFNSIPEKKQIFLDKNIKNAQKIIASLELDILIFCEIGMSFDAYLLAFSRLALIQCNTWGHSDTSGIDTIDYFISSKLYELDFNESKKNYSEKLILTDNLCTYYYDPIEMYLNDYEKNNLLDRNYFNLPKDKNLYACLQSPFKITYEYDPILKKILQNDQDSLIIMIDNEANILKNQVLPRFEKNLGKEMITRFKIFNKMSLYKFYSLFNNCDVEEVSNLDLQVSSNMKVLQF